MLIYGYLYISALLHFILIMLIIIPSLKNKTYRWFWGIHAWTSTSSYPHFPFLHPHTHTNKCSSFKGTYFSACLIRVTLPSLSSKMTGVFQFLVLHIDNDRKWPSLSDYEYCKCFLKGLVDRAEISDCKNSWKYCIPITNILCFEFTK